MTKSYHLCYFLNTPIIEVIHINTPLTQEEFERAKGFIARMRPLIKFGEYTIQRNWKNEEFEETYPMRDADRRRILDSLSAEDCIRINRNTNPRYDDAEVFVFLKDAAVYIYGEMENIK